MNTVCDNGQHIARLFERGVNEYRLLDPGDRVLAAISGGKDSLTMLHFLNELRRQGGKAFELVAIHIKTDFHCASCMHRDVLTEIFDQLGVEYHIKHIKVLDENKTTDCFRCSWQRRKCLFETARDLNCNKIAFGHHKDDIIETTLLNLFFRAEISAMKPRQELFGGKVAIVRPLCFVEEEAIAQFAQTNNFPAKLCRCPFGVTSQRKAMKKLIREFTLQHPHQDIRANIFNSLTQIGTLPGAEGLAPESFLNG